MRFSTSLCYLLGFFLSLEFFAKTLAIGAFLLFLFATNYYGIKKAARINDLLTIVKLFPLFLIIVLGLGLAVFNPGMVLQNFQPFAPFGFGGFGEALVLIFWAYVGFEIATIPGSEIENPEKTIPKAVILGIGIVTFFYVITNLALLSIAGMQLAGQEAPLAFAASLVLGSLGAVVIAVGALFSVSGSDESNIIGTTRLGYALAADGYFPKAMARLHPKYSSPFVSLTVHTLLAFFLTMFFSIQEFIIFSTFNFAIVYLLVTLAAFVLNKHKTFFEKAILYASVLVCLFLLLNIRLTELLAGIGAIGFAMLFYPFISKKERKEEKEFLLREEHVLYRMVRHEEVFLANLFKHLKIRIRQSRGLEHAHSLREREHSHSKTRPLIKF